MKIEYFTDSYLPGMGGTEMAVVSLCKSLKDKHQVAVACPKYKAAPEDLGWPVFLCKSIMVKKPQSYCAFSSLDKKFRTNIEEFKPDIIHAQSVNDMLSRAIKLGKKLDVPVVATVHTKFKDCWLKDTHSHLITACMLSSMKNLLKKVDLITTVSNDMAKALKEYGVKAPVVVIKNGCRRQRCNNVEELRKKGQETLKLNDDTFMFLFVGRVEKVKNIDFSLEMLKKLKETNKNFVFFIAGKGEGKTYFENRIKELELEDNVKLLGPVSEEVLDLLYARADLFLFPSIFDNDSLAICEAACFKTPSVAIKNTGSSERITDGKNGFVVENDVNHYVQTMKKVMEDKKLLETVKENAYIDLPVSWEETSKLYLDLYKKQILKHEIKKSEKVEK